MDLFQRYLIFRGIKDFGKPEIVRSFTKVYPTTECGTADGVESKDLEIEYMGLKLKFRMFKPTGLKENEQVPVSVFLHAGGLCVLSPAIKSEHYICQQICKLSKCIVFSVDYRLAPENKWPAMLDDAFAFSKWVIESDHELLEQCNKEKFWLFGISGAGSITTGTMLKLKEEGLEKKVKAMVLVCPWLQVTPEVESRYSEKWTYLTYNNFLDWCQVCLFDKEKDTLLENPLISPLKAETLEFFPPCCLVSADRDPIRDEIYLLKKKLKKDGVPVIYKKFEHSVHGFIGKPFLEQTKLAFDMIEKFLRENDLNETKNKNN
ncbi:ab hydrolase superfamily protein c4a8.06c [Anaeramoeba flamelloides]|uniref:Ab hydrolase superfamily protein c4a8.06c n=1 Tax=Anaeramoeba flamelloides TaxID=1746091 RepID=A0AAV8A254_9EUKA|nr:ab hydrolase superfamily protein c4a8.06c [Anaeramoeba flamelloides]KAJ6243797.1 ab hydrolase superfamily protein c4a8.06c [Anaeramoeba flamelloides]